MDSFEMLKMASYTIIIMESQRKICHTHLQQFVSNLNPKQVNSKLSIQKNSQELNVLIESFWQVEPVNWRRVLISL